MANFTSALERRQDLVQELVRNGLARIYGMRMMLWGGRTSKQHDDRLAELEADAKREKRDGWKQYE